MIPCGSGVTGPGFPGCFDRKMSLEERQYIVPSNKDARALISQLATKGNPTVPHNISHLQVATTVPTSCYTATMHAQQTLEMKDAAFEEKIIQSLDKPIVLIRQKASGRLCAMRKIK